MIDAREQIILRLVELLGSVSGITAVYRDRGQTTEDSLPAAYVLDGEETIPQEARDGIFRSKSVKMRPTPMTLRPQIFILLKPRDTVLNLTLDNVSAPIGPELSAYRFQVLSAIVNDPTLLGLLTTNGQMIYLGCDTDMQTMSAMNGSLQMHFEFTYFLDMPRG
jgi:hypothetical protein